MNKKNLLDEYKAHAYCSGNKSKLLESSQKCGCFHCTKIFMSEEIIEYIDWMEKESDEVGFAICPHCGIDSVIGEYTGYPITTKFMNKMRLLWFN